MKSLMFFASSFVAMAAVAAGTIETLPVKSAVAMAEQRALRFQPNGHAQMWRVYDGFSKLEHVYIRIPGGFTDESGKKITNPKTGKVIETWGFYFRRESVWGHKPMPGIIEGPDSMEGQGTQIVEQGNDSLFDHALANQIRNSMKHVPTYTWGDKTHKTYVCFNWADDMWKRAFDTVYRAI